MRREPSIECVDVLDEDRPGSRAVALPQLEPMGTVVGHEEEGSANVGQFIG